MHVLIIVLGLVWAVDRVAALCGILFFVRQTERKLHVRSRHAAKKSSQIRNRVIEKQQHANKHGGRDFVDDVSARDHACERVRLVSLYISLAA
jgi:hypothetical protein